MDIVERSNTTLRLLEQNDPKLISNRDRDYLSRRGCFSLHDGTDLSRLGNAIANNTHLLEITFDNSSEWTLDVTSLFEGLQRNTTIKKLSLHSIGSGIWNRYVVNNIRSLTHVSIVNCDIRGSLAGSIAQDIIMKCPNLKDIIMCMCNIDDAGLKDIVSGFRGIPLQRLHMWNCRIGVQGAEAIKNLLQDPNCNVTHLRLSDADLNNESIRIIVNCLRGNTILEHLSLSGNKIKRSGYESIATLLQDIKSNINKIDLAHNNIDDDRAELLAQALIGNTKCLELSLNPGITESGWNAFFTILSNCSNTTLNSLNGNQNMPVKLSALLKLNRVVDMAPLFELDEDDERKPKALPCVVDWFDRCGRESQNEELVNTINARKLSAIFQFALAMPLKFVPSLYQTRLAR